MLKQTYPGDETVIFKADTLASVLRIEILEKNNPDEKFQVKLEVFACWEGKYLLILQSLDISNYR